MIRALVSVTAALLVATWVGSSYAQDTSVAEALYEDGKRLLADGQVAAACEKLEASQHADPALGTLILMATCHEQQGRSATAWGEFTDAAAQAAAASRHDREAFARSHADALVARVHRIVVEISTVPEGLQVALDEAQLAAGAVGTALPVDAGTHVLRVSSPGKVAWSKSLTVQDDGATEKVTVPPLEDLPAPPPPNPPPAATSEAPTRGEAPPPPASSSPSTRRTVAWWLVGAGGVALVTSAITGGLVIKMGNDIASECPGRSCPNQSTLGSAQNEASQGNTLSTVSTVAFGVGLASAGVGVVLLLTQPRDRVAVTGVVPMVGPGTAGVGWSAAF
jgi:hypothetical protein